METIQIKELRSKLGQVFADLNAPVEITSRGKIIGYIVKELSTPDAIPPAKTPIIPTVTPKNPFKARQDATWSGPLLKSQQTSKKGFNTP